MEFETERFKIRKFTMHDLDAFFDMQSSPMVMQYIKDPLNYEESRIELEKFIGYYSNKERFFLLWAIESKRGGQFVGLCGVYENAERENEIAYRLMEKFWGQGIGSEIAVGLISHCFSNMALNEIVAFADEDNVGSVKILDRHMEFEKRFFSMERNRFALKYTLQRPL